MGYKGKDNREKVCSEAYRVLPTEDYKTIVGENRCNDISFRPLSGYCQKRKARLAKIVFFPKPSNLSTFGKDSIGAIRTYDFLRNPIFFA